MGIMSRGCIDVGKRRELGAASSREVPLNPSQDAVVGRRLGYTL